MYNLPTNATKLEYIESTGTQWINTGVNNQSGLVIKGEFQVQRDSLTGICNLFGGRTAALNRSVIVGVGTFRGSSQISQFSYNSTTVRHADESDDISIVLNDNQGLINTVEYDHSSATFSGTSPIHVCGFSSAGTHNANIGSVKVKSFSISQNGVVLCDYVPVRVGSIGCVFDRVTGQLIYSSGSEDFICGPDKFSKFSHSVKHLSDTGNILAGRVMGDPSGTIKAVRKHYDIGLSYVIDENNGGSLLAANANFPSDTYSALDYTPTKTDYVFSGWDKVPASEIVGIEYLETSGTQYINTGVKAALSTNFEITFQSTTTTTENYFVLAGRQAMSSNECCLRFHSKNGVMDKVYIVLKSTSTELWYSASVSQNHIAKVTKTGTTIVCGSHIKNPTISDFSTDVDMLLFGMLQANGSVQIAPGLRIYRAKMYDGSTLVRDFMPVRVGTEGCMYDAVTKTVFRNAGTGDFIKGADSEISPFDAVDSGDPVDYALEKVTARYAAPLSVTFDATTNGGAMPSGWVSPTYHVGDTFGTLPLPTKSGCACIGWFTPFGIRVEASTVVSYENSYLIAKYEEVTWATTYSVTTTSSYKKTGIFTATRSGGGGTTSNPIIVDWGDGTQDTVFGHISSLTHTYSSVATFTVKISDNINAICFSTNNATWYQTTSQNQYTLKKILTLSSNITQLSAQSFYYCDALTDVVIPSGATSIPNHCFYYCKSLKSSSVTLPSTVTSIGNSAFYYCNGTNFSSLTIPAAVTSIGTYAFYQCTRLALTFESGSSTLTLNSYCFSYLGNSRTSGWTIDLSPRKITSIPTYCFYYCYYLKGITWPQGVTSIGASAFGYCFNYSASSGTIEIPEGVTSISGTYAFRNCLYLTAVTLPSTLTNLNNYTFYCCTRLATITSNRSTAPTVSAQTFGNSNTYYTGRSSYSAGTNKLYVPVGATGYTSSYWADPLCSSTKCGFTLEYSYPVYSKKLQVNFDGSYVNLQVDNTSNGTLSISELLVVDETGAAPVVVTIDHEEAGADWTITRSNGSVWINYDADVLSFDESTFTISNLNTEDLSVVSAEWIDYIKTMNVYFSNDSWINPVKITNTASGVLKVVDCGVFDVSTGEEDTTAPPYNWHGTRSSGTVTISDEGGEDVGLYDESTFTLTMGSASWISSVSWGADL